MSWTDRLGDAWDAVNDVADTAAKPMTFTGSKIGAAFSAAADTAAGEAVGAALGKGLFALNYPLEQSKKLYSTGMQVGANPINPAGHGLDTLFSPDAWSQAWKRSDDISAGQAIETEFFNGINVPALTPKKLENVVDMPDMYTPEGIKAQKEYYTGTWSGKLSSGAVDVFLDFNADPLVGVGKGAKAASVAAKTIKAGDVAGSVALASEKIAAPTARALTAAEIDAVDSYAVSRFEPINSALRKSEKLDPDLADQAKSIDTAIDASPLNAPTTLFRTVSLGGKDVGASHFPTALRKGQVITDKGFFSTSKTLEGATGGTADNIAGKAAPVVLELSAPAGTKAVDLNSVLGGASTPSEAEVLLGRGTKYKILGEETKTIDRPGRGPVDVRYVKAEIVAPKASSVASDAFTRGENKGADKLTRFIEQTDSLSASQMAQLPQLRSTGDAGAFAHLFESANKEFAGDSLDVVAQRRQAKIDIMGAALGNVDSIQAVKDRSAQIAEQIQRFGEPPATTAAYELYDTTDFGQRMIQAYNGGDRDAVIQLTKEHEDEYARLQRVITAAGSTSQIAAGPLEKVGLIGKAEKLDERYTGKLRESYMFNGLAGKPIRFVVGQASTRVQGSVHVKDPTRGFDDLLSVVSRMSHTPAAQRRALMDEFVKAPSEAERRNIVDKVEATMFRDAAKRYGVSEKAAKKLLTEAGGRRSAYNQGLSGRLYSAADTTGLAKAVVPGGADAGNGFTGKLVSFYDPEDDQVDVFEKAFLQTHIENTHNVSDPKVLDQILKRGTNRRMLERWAEAYAPSAKGAATAASDISSISRDTLDNWGTMITRVWKDSALMRVAYPVRVQIDTQLRVMAHLGMMKYFLDGKTALGEYMLQGLKGSDKDVRLASVLGPQLKGERSYLGEKLLGPKPDTYKRIPLNPAVDDEDVQRVISSFESTGGAAADIGNDISAAALRSRRKDGSWGKTMPTDPGWFDAWKRSADQVRTSPTARKALEDDDIERLKKFVETDPKAKAEWLNFRESSDSVEEWLGRIVAHNDHLFPTPELRATIRNPAEAKDLFDLTAASIRKEAKPGALADRKLGKETYQEASKKLSETMAKWKAAEPRSAERRALKAQADEFRAAKKAARDLHTEAKDVVEQLNRKPSVGERTFATGKLEPMPVHGETFSPLTKDSWGARWNNFRNSFYHWAADAPETIVGRSPIYIDSYKQYIKDAADRLGDDGVDLVGIDRIRAAADRAARKEVANILFDATHASNLSHGMRFISPFFSAWEDTMKKWSKLMTNNPSVAPTFVKAWNAPNQMGWVQDQDGNPLKAGEHAARGEYIVIPKIPGVNKIVPGNGSFKLRKDSLNILFQGDPPWLPGNGPLVQIPANEVVKRYFVKEADNPVLHYILPFGITDDSIGRQVMPSWAKQAKDAFGGTKDFNQQYVVLMNQELGRYQRGERKTKPDADEIGGKTRNWFILRAALNNAAPVSIQPTPKDQFYIDKARQYRADPNRKGHWQEDFYDDFPGYFEMSATLSVNETGLQATNEAFDAAKKYRKQIKENPKLGWFFAGADNLTGEFNPNVNTYQRSTEAGKGLNYRSTKDPSQAVADVQEQKGWIEYNKAATYINLELEKRGLTIQSKGAEDLANLKRAYVSYLGQNNTAWAMAYQQRDSSGVIQLRSVAEDAWKKNKDFANRSDQVLLKNYFDARDQLTELKNSGKATNTSATNLLNAYGAFLAKSSPAFEQIYNRTLENDDISQVVG